VCGIAGIVAFDTATFIGAVALIDIAGAFAGNEPIASTLPQPLSSILYPIPPDYKNFIK
jgi:hypothetical protein